MSSPIRLNPAANDEAMATSFQLHRLTAGLAHNVNNALTGVIGYLELAMGLPEPAADVDGYLHSSLDCAYQAADAVRRIVRCTGLLSTAEPPTPQSLRNLAEQAAGRVFNERRGCQTAITGTSVEQVHVSADLIALALDGLLHAVAIAADDRLELRLADEEGRCALSDETGVKTALADLQLRLLETSLLIEIQGGSLEILPRPGKPTTVKISFPCRCDIPVRRDEAQTLPAAPHRPAAMGFLRQAV